MALVLELIEGETLAERLRAGAMPVEETLEVCRQIAEAHGGRIVARNREGGGLALLMTLPTRAPGPPPT